jgi:flagellar secretion chaperone FliS
MNPYSTARQAYTESSVLTAPPERLVVMLYDGAIRFLRQASTAMRSGNRGIALVRVQRAEAIINELNLSLDLSQGEISTRLRSIYLFCKRHLSEALIERDADKVDEVIRLLGDLREAWEQIAGRASAAGESAAAAS